MPGKESTTSDRKSSPCHGCRPHLPGSSPEPAGRGKFMRALEEVRPASKIADQNIENRSRVQEKASVEDLAGELERDLRKGFMTLARKVFQLERDSSKDEIHRKAEDINTVLESLGETVNRLRFLGRDGQRVRHLAIARRVPPDSEVLSPDHRELLIASPLFRGLTNERSRDLVALGKHRRLKHKEFFFMAETGVDSFFLILSGKVKEYYLGEDGEEYVIRLSHPGEYLGVSALFLNDGSHTSFAEAIGPVTAMSFYVPSFLSILSDDPVLNRNLLTLMSCRLECARKQCCLGQKMNAEWRVANYLLDQTGSWSSETRCGSETCCTLVSLRPLKLSAQEIGLARETFARILSRFKQNGIIDFHRGQVRLLDKRALENLARC